MKTLGKAVLCRKTGKNPVYYEPVNGFADNAWWEIEAEPHVMLHLKRVFGRLNALEFGKVHLKDTEETCRDLQWFVSRYPLEIIPASYLMERAASYENRIKEFDDLLTGKAAPFEYDELAIPARRYQTIATDLWIKSKGLLVADDLGLGKTLVAIAGFTRPDLRPALVITLTHLTYQWQREINKFTPGLNASIITTGRPVYTRGNKRLVFRTLAEKRVSRVLGALSSLANLANAEYDYNAEDVQRIINGVVTAVARTKALFSAISPDVLIMNYHKLAGWADTLSGRLKSVVFDECQELRRIESQKYKAALHITERAHYVLGLSATPFYNYGDEMYNVLNVLKRDVLGTKEEFIREWCKIYGWRNSNPISDPKAFGTYLRSSGLMLRRTCADVKRELPAVIRIPHYVEADASALDSVADAASELARIILSKNTAVLERGQAARDLDWRLRQATGISKAPYVAEFVRLLLESGEKVVLFGWHREVYSIWQERLKNYNPVFFTGTENAKQKEASREAFCGGDARLLIMSLRAGAGLDGLQYHSHITAFGELDWSPAVHEQNEGRENRDGQTNTVLSYYLLSDHGSDPVIADVLGLKRSQIEGIRDPNADLIERLDTDPGRVTALAKAYLSERGLL